MVGANAAPKAGGVKGVSDADLYTIWIDRLVGVVDGQLSNQRRAGKHRQGRDVRLVEQLGENLVGRQLGHHQFIQRLLIFGAGGQVPRRQIGVDVAPATIHQAVTNIHQRTDVRQAIEKFIHLFGVGFVSGQAAPAVGNVLFLQGQE